MQTGSRLFITPRNGKDSSLLKRRLSSERISAGYKSKPCVVSHTNLLTKRIEMNGIIITCVLITLASAQFLLNHTGDIENTIQGYRFQFHDQFNLLLVIHSLDCYISEVPHGSALETELLNATTRIATYQKMIPILQAGKDITKTELQQVHQKYGDYLIRALCFRSEIYNLDASKIV